MRSARLPPVLLLLALLGASAPPARAAGGALDLSLVEQRAAEGEGQVLGGRVGRAYTRLVARLSVASEGLLDDLAKLRAAARACAGPLSADLDLRDAVRDSLGEGATAIRALDAEVVGMAGDLLEEGHRATVLGMAARARALERTGEIRLYLADDTGAARHFRRGALGLQRARSRAEELLEKETPDADTWQVALSGRAGALLGVWGEAGPSPRLYAVGAEDAQGPQFLVLHPGAEGWVRIPVAPSGDLWWVTVVPGDGAWASGSGGRVVRYSPATGALDDLSTGENAILYGVWGSGPSDVWAVGGDPQGLGPAPALCHWNGEGWSIEAAPPEADGRILYKVWGTAQDDVWAVGQGGLLLHYDGMSWSSVPSGTASVLLTVHGGSFVAAVGGGASAVAVERDVFGSWAPVPVTGVTGGTGSQFPEPVQTLNGVFVTPGGDGIAVGLSRSVVRRRLSGWTGVGGVPASVKDLHAVWMDEAGNATMVGGKLADLTEGQVVTLGRRTLPSAVVPRARYLGDVADILYLTCAHSGCHLPPFNNANLQIDDPATTHAALVGAPSDQAPLLRVKPYRPSQSYLWHKLLGTHLSVGGSGVRMPEPHGLYLEYLSQDQMDRIRGWILDGARDD